MSRFDLNPTIAELLEPPADALSHASVRPAPTGRRFGRVRCWTWAFAGLLGATLVGCGDGKPAPLKVAPVTGVIKYQGQATPGAIITLHPKDSAIPEDVRPNAIADETGHFDLGTYSDADGAPEGEYAVTITWRPLVISDSGASPGPNRLPAKYSIPETSPLTVTIGDEETELKPFELTE